MKHWPKYNYLLSTIKYIWIDKIRKKIFEVEKHKYSLLHLYIQPELFTIY